MRALRRLLLACLPLACLAALPGAASAAPHTTWLCGPAMKHDPCTPGLDTMRVSATGSRLGSERIRAPRRPKIDCFYVYPTVSDQKAPQATLHIDPEERSIARYQAAYYSQECRVFAPMYRQVTLAGLLAPGTVTARMRRQGYRDVAAAWRDYLAHFNHGRGVVLIGHSQGTFVLRQLIAKEIDGRPATRRLLVSALLLGGDVTVAKGRDTGGDFRHVPACRRARQIGCVVAFSTFDGPVPADSKFGRTPDPRLEVLCTNPAALRGGSARLHPVFPTVPFAKGTIGTLTTSVALAPPPEPTPWVEVDGAYRGRCSSAGGAHVLQLTPAPGPLQLKATPDPTWGLHLVDANIALGDLVRLVRTQAAEYQGRRPA